MSGASKLQGCDADHRAAWLDFDPDRDAGPVPSPCIRVCEISPVTGWCIGCQRRLEEIGSWGGLSEDARGDVWRRIRARRSKPEGNP